MNSSSICSISSLLLEIYRLFVCMLRGFQTFFFAILFQYIKLLRKTANLEKLREAREAMSAMFPLSPSLWLEWARDEASLASR